MIISTRKVKSNLNHCGLFESTCDFFQNRFFFSKPFVNCSKVLYALLSWLENFQDSGFIVVNDVTVAITGNRTAVFALAPFIEKMPLFSISPKIVNNNFFKFSALGFPCKVHSKSF